LKSKGVGFLDSLYFVQNWRTLGKYRAHHYVRQNRRSPKIVLGGGGLDLLPRGNKSLKILGDFYQFGIVKSWGQAHLFEVTILLPRDNFLGEFKMSATNYSEVIVSVKNAIKVESDTQYKWEKAGSMVAEFYQSAKALEEVKAQFISDAILPAMDKKHGQALAVDLPRKGSKEFNEKCSNDAGYADKWEIANQAKKDARAISNTLFTRIVKYAFPPEKKESVKKTFAEKISALIQEGGKIKECDFDLVKVMGFLIQAEQATKIKI
jgi:hypothetical protein